MSDISIVMATYNGAEFLTAQLVSLAHQSKLPTELVICDDASTDNTVFIAQQFVLNAPFPVHIHSNSHRKGYRRNFIDAAKLCSSELIAFCDQDDVWHKDKLHVVDSKFTDHAILLAYHGYRVVNSKGSVFFRQSPAYCDVGCIEPLSIDPWTYALGFTQVFRKRLLQFGDYWPKSVDFWCPKEQMAHDQWFFFLSSVFGKIAPIDQELVDYRQHARNLYGTTTATVNKYVQKLHKMKVDDEELFQLSRLANNRAVILREIAADHKDLPEIADRALEGAAWYDGLERRWDLRARIYQNVWLPKRLKSWCRLVGDGGYGSRVAATFPIQSAIRDAVFGVLLGQHSKVSKAILLRVLGGSSIR